MNKSLPTRRSDLAALAMMACVAACGGGTTDTGGNNPDIEQIAKASPSGDGQAGNANATLDAPLRVVITKSGTGVSGKTVTWSVTNGQGTLSPTTTTTGSDGVASTVVTLGSSSMTISAASTGVSGSPVSFTALVIGLTADVSLGSSTFTPQTVAIKAGGTVTFTWVGSGHNVVPDGGNDRPESPDAPATKNAGFSFEASFPAPGTYFYHCTVHGGNQTGMFGKVVVVP